MMLSYIKLGIILTLTQESISRNPFRHKHPPVRPTTTTSSTPLKQVKRPYQQGINCNMDAYHSATWRVYNWYFCVPRSGCRSSPHRNPVIPYDLCNDYYNGVGDEDLTCCHQSDFKEKPDSNWTESDLFLPSFRSFVMCRHYSQLLCDQNGNGYCDKKTLELKTTASPEGVPETIETFPHTALVGFPTDPSNQTFRWFCMGSIVSERAIITARNCEFEHYQGVDKYSTHVKVGESFICDFCIDRPGEQLIPIWRWEFQLDEKSDIYFILLKQDIQFNQKVRPACFLRQPFNPTSGWYVHHGKTDTPLVKTDKTFWPVFHYTDNNTFFAFKVKTSHNAVIHLSETGGPHKKGNNWEITIGKLENNKTQSSIDRIAKTYVTVPNILNENQFRGFWIKKDHDGNLLFGEEDKSYPLMGLEDLKCCFNITVIGLSTPDSTGEWLLPNHEGLFTLHGHNMDVQWGQEKCGIYHPKFETVNKYVGRTKDRTFIGEAEFCAGDEHTGVAPCDYDWGSTIQIMDRDKMPCMWQMFGMYSQDEKRNCSAVLSPGVFTNFANHLAYMEDIAYPDFSNEWYKLKLNRPKCLLSPTNYSEPGRCPDFIINH